MEVFPFIAFFFPLILSLSSHALTISAAAPSNLNELCDVLGEWYVSPQVCHSVLDSHPQSRTADLNGLGIIAANIAAKNATSIEKEIQSLLTKASSGTDQQKILNTCLQLYKDVVPQLEGVAESIKGKKYSTAETMLNAVSKVPASCDDAAKNDAALWSVLNHYDSLFTNMVYVAHAISATIVRHSG